MKSIKNILLLGLMILTVAACKDGYIDDITQVDPGADEDAPQISVNFPPEGYELQATEEIATINFDFEVKDDIEIASILLKVNGTEIASYTEFKDYRVFFGEYLYDNVTTGSHVLTVEAIDNDGKSSVVNVNYVKAPPYVPEYEGEIFYMPFNSEYREMNSLELATVNGMPAFTDGIQGGTAYLGAADSYLTFPTSILEGSTEFSAAFWMKVDNSMDRAGVLTVAPPADDNNDRTKGFRFFREDAGGMQRFKLNVGNGDSDSWFDGGSSADVTPNTGEWEHMAFTISETACLVYINGEVAAQGDFTGVDWTGCDVISIMSGAPNWGGWNHLSDGSGLDELRMFNKALTQEEIQAIKIKEEAIFYMDFDGDYSELYSGEEATVVGNPSFAYGEGVVGDAYVGAEEAYLTLPTSLLQNADEFSASFWLKVDNSLDRAGVLVVSPPADNNNDRTKGFRFFREDAGGMQRFKLNAGNGEADSWFDGGDAADVTPNSGEWTHFAFTISNTQSTVYINGDMVTQGDFTGIDWTDCDVISIMSGAPNWTGWNHKSDASMMDELRLFKKALTPDEVMASMH